METLPPPTGLPDDTLPAASAALKRLAELSTSLQTELGELPTAQDTLLDAITTSDTSQRELEVARLLQRIDDYWDSPSASDGTRYEKFLTGMQQTLRDELSVKIHERDLTTQYLACLPASRRRSDSPTAVPPKIFSLHVKLQEQEQVEVAGALVMSQDQGHTLLIMPGIGATGFTSQAQMLETLPDWLNSPTLRDALFNCIEQRHQDVLTEIGNDPDLHLEPFTAADLLLTPISDSPYAHAMDRLIDKQRKDVRYASMLTSVDNREKHQALIQNAIGMRGLFGPGALLELRELASLESRYRRSLPDWIKMASQDDRSTYAERLQQYDQARAVTVSALNAAASPEQFARAQLRIRMANDLGYDLDPSTIKANTQRTLPVTGEAYTVTRSLTELALYGLHPGDGKAGSEFLGHTTLSLEDAPLAEEHSSLTPAYLVKVIEELDLRLTFAAFQQAQYRKEHNQQLMHLLTRRQISALAYAAKMQGHIRPEDFTIVETVTNPAQGNTDFRLIVQQVKLNRQVLSKLLVVRQETTTGQLERLIMVAVDAPQTQCFWAFDNQTQLRNELVGWVVSDKLCDYLLNQVEVAARAGLAAQLAALKLKPYPPEGFLELVSLSGFDAGLRILAEQHIRVALSEQQRHTPDWYRHATPAQRQELVALEDAANGARKNYDAKPHTHMQSFKAYTHERASRQISKLLDVPVGRVDPDLIVISSERETLTYTDMLLNGYDDSIGIIRSTADTQATFRGPEGVNLSALSPVKVAESVRNQWLADDYIALVKNTLLNTGSQGYEYRRKTSLLMTQLQMKAAALRSLLKGHISATQYQWLWDSIDHAHLSDARTREQYPLYPLQIHVDKPFIASGVGGIDQLVIPDTNLIHVETVQGCVAILPMSIRQAALLYTHQAPDGIEFRLFSSFTDSLGTPGMIDYYKDRCRIKSRKTLSFFLRDMQQGNANKAPFLPKESISDFADTCFNRPILRKLRDVEETTTGRNDMLAKLIWVSIEVIATVVTLPFPPASFAVGALLSLHDTVRALQSLREGDSETASAYILTAMLNSFGAAGDLHSGLKGFGGVVRQIGPPPPSHSALRPVQRSSSLPRYEDMYPINLYDEPFLVGKPDANGYFPVLRNVSDASTKVDATGQFVRPGAGGTWQPPGHALDIASPSAAGLRDGLEVHLSLSNVPRISDGHAKGVCTINGRQYIEFSGKTFEVQYDTQIRSWQIIDPGNPFAFFGKQPVSLDEQGKWQLVDRQQLRGGGRDSPQDYRPLPDTEAAGTGTNLSDYELPGQMQPHMELIISGEGYDPSGLGMMQYFETYFMEMRLKFTVLREKLYHDAHAFFSAPSLPPRPSLPALESGASIDTLFESLLAHSSGLVLSEAPRSVASKRLLIQNMPLLVKERVEILYIEHLFSDKHLPKLARYRQLGKKTRSGSHEIKEHLEYINDKALNNQTTEYDYYHLIKIAHRHGIEVRPFSSSISYPLISHPVAPAAGDTAASQKMSNFFGHKLISGDVASDPSRRWIALLDEKLASTHNQLPGIAELEGVPSIHIQDVASGSPTRIKATAGAASTDSATHCDFTIEFANPLTIAPAKPLPESTLLDMALFKDLGNRQSIENAQLWSGEYGFRWGDTKGWLRIEPDHWTPNSPSSAIQKSLADATYEVPLENRSTLYQLANFEHKGLDQHYFFLDPELSVVRGKFFKVRTKLQADARNIAAVELPPRPTLPKVEPQAPLPDFLQTLYQHTDGIVIGEVHSSVASKKLIIDNLPLLSQQKVKTLYLEHLLADLHQADLDRFFETGQMSKTLLHDLKRLDRGHHTDPNRIHTFEQLVLKAQQHGVEIRAIDCSASYHLKGILGDAPTTRQQMMNYFAHITIRKHQEVMGSHKWIALVGNTHANTYQQIIPGIAELEAGIGLRVTDAPPGNARGVIPDPGERIKRGLGTETVPIKSDYLVEMEITGATRALPVRPPQTLPAEQRLTRPGMFLIEQSEDGQQTIVHRSRDTFIHRTPVQVNAEGKLYIDRPTWTNAHLTPYNNMFALVEALEELNLMRVT
ncbi:membrane-targeted effector domain-containing toxin [Pseudomonas sp. KFB-139]|uniref:Membrane-targeted effector domain-containing toxin n=1 Tax=Pseudomonas serbiensis TaxID=3064350 RepID=A0ABT9CT63_9PSED|nr:membrane-targeted effector domain-containing toxin [Pseudomonas sp. KFB-138]MDO7927306.1 membrane-targeted effector domain-containing toxin [Pseudomonas sp. KFB-138]